MLYMEVTCGQVVKSFDCGPKVAGLNPIDCLSSKVFLYPSSHWETRLWLKGPGGKNQHLFICVHMHPASNSNSVYSIVRIKGDYTAKCKGSGFPPFPVAPTAAASLKNKVVWSI